MERARRKKDAKFFDRNNLISKIFGKENLNILYNKINNNEFYKFLNNAPAFLLK